MLARCQEGGSGEYVWIPERNLPITNRFIDELLPGIVFQNEIAQEGVLRLANVQLFGGAGPGLPLKKVIGRQHSFSANGYGSKEQKRQDYHTGHDEKVCSICFKPAHIVV